ncbi:MAG: LamG-like jellyroll fold domain-containing protein [Akkermansiaceae bacterium]
MKASQYVTIIMTSLGIAAASQAAIVTDLIGYYDFEETGVNGLKNKAPGATGFDGTWSGGTFDVADQDGPGFAGNAAYNPGDGLSNRGTLLVGNALNIVDGNNDFADIPIGVTDTGKSMTVSFWAYLAPGASNASARFHAFETGDSGVYDLSVGTIGTYSSNGRDDYSVYGPSNNQIGASIAGFSEETWYHHAITTQVSGDDIISTYYLNGVVTRSETSTDAALGTTFAFTGLHFGDGRSGSGERDWDGLIDEAAVWSRELSQSEITQVYNNGLNGVAVTVPEPSSTALLGLGGLALILRRRK